MARLASIADPEEQRREFAELSRQRHENAAEAVEAWLARVIAERRRRQDALANGAGEGEATLSARGRRTARRSAGSRRG